MPIIQVALPPRALFAAATTLDPDAPRIPRIAGGSATPRAITEIMSAVSGKQFMTLSADGLDGLDVVKGIAKLFGISDLSGHASRRDIMGGEGKRVPFENDRYLDMSRVADHLARVVARSDTSSRRTGLQRGDQRVDEHPEACRLVAQ